MNRSRRWFRRAGWFYLPITLPGVVVVVLALAFAVQLFVAIDRRSHSVSDTLYGVFPYVVGTFLLVDWIARQTSGPPD